MGVISSRYDAEYESSWLGSDDSAATRTNQGPGWHCEGAARVTARGDDALREWSEGEAKARQVRMFA